jgi:hypothetical protein
LWSLKWVLVLWSFYSLFVSIWSSYNLCL